MSTRSHDDGTVSISIPRSALIAVAAPPTHLTQRTSEAVIGLPRRAFLRLASEFAEAGGRASRVGRLVMVDRLLFVGWLESRNLPSVEPALCANDGDHELAAELGLVRGGRR